MTTNFLLNSRKQSFFLSSVLTELQWIWPEVLKSSVTVDIHLDFWFLYRGCWLNQFNMLITISNSHNTLFSLHMRLKVSSTLSPKTPISLWSHYKCDRSFLAIIWQQSFLIALIKIDLSYLCVDWSSHEGDESYSHHLTLSIFTSKSGSCTGWCMNPGHIFIFSFNSVTVCCPCI